MSPTIAIDSNSHLHVAWSDGEIPGNTEIYYKKSTNGGVTWTNKRLSWTSGLSLSSAIAVNSSNHIHVVWSEETPANAEIFYKKSTDGGATWSSKRLTWTSGNSRWPAIAVDSSNHIHVVCYDDTPGNYNIYYKKSTDQGATWSTRRLSWGSDSSGDPAIAVDSNNHIQVVWYYYPTISNAEIYHTKSTDGGISWSTKRLTWNTRHSYAPAIAADSNNHLHVVWQDSSPGNWEIFYKRSTDGGTIWTTKRLTDNADTSSGPHVTVDSNNYLHVTWFDSTPGNKELYYTRSTNGGVTWTDKRLTWNPGQSESPAITADSDNHLHLVWTDDTSGNQEIYYRKGIQ